MAGEAGQEKRARAVLTICVHLFLIALVSCTVSLYFLKLNPDHLLLLDDSYITLRFASNLFKYGGITYDGSLYFTGATSPLHIVFVAVLGQLLKLETASLAVGIIFFIFSCLMVYLWSLKIYNSKQTAFLAGLMMSICHWLAADALNGLETTSFIFFSLLTFYLFYTYRAKPFYIIPLFLSIVTRPEGWFLASALFTWQVFEYGTQKDKTIMHHLSIAIIFFMLLIVPYALLLFYYTGSLLPSTAFSKALFLAEARLPLINRMIFFVKGMVPFYNNLLFAGSLFILPLILFARGFITTYYFWIYYFIFYISYFLFLPGAIGTYWYRYQHIFIPMLIIGIAGGVVEVSKICKRRIVRFAINGLLVLVIFYHQGAALMDLNITYPVAVSHTKGIINLALWLKHHTPRGSLIALHDIGVVGYFSEREIVDLVGLVNPEMNKYYWDESSKTPLPRGQRRIIDYLRVKKPDYLVVFPRWDRYFNFAQPDTRQYFKHAYSAHGYEVFTCIWGG